MRQTLRSHLLSFQGDGLFYVVVVLFYVVVVVGQWG